MTANVSRKAGGLFWSVKGLARGLQDAGCHIAIFAAEDCCSAEDLAHWEDLPLTILQTRGPSTFGFSPGLVSALTHANLDVLHTHGIWMYPSVAATKWRLSQRGPTLVSPRGMLDVWATQRSALKKRIAGWLYEGAHLSGAACIHALCEPEYRAIRAYGLRNPVAIIPNGVDLPVLESPFPPPDWAARLPANRLTLLFLGRIHPKKGLANLLQAWAVARAKRGADKWHLVIAGWDQVKHEAELRCQVHKLGLRDSVSFVGPQFGEEKVRSLAWADAFVLPSFSEGLPMAVLEAWSCCLPVLITPECNLPEGFASGASLAISPEVGSIQRGLEELFAMSEDARLEMGRHGRLLAEDRFSWPAIADRMRSVYSWLLGMGPKPDCVNYD